jgi:predicted ester cyclase
MQGELDRNKGLVREHFEALVTGDFNSLEGLHDAAGRNHAAAPFDLSEWPADGRPFGPAEVRATFEWLRAGTTNIHVDVEELIAEGNQVDAWVRMTGTHAGLGGPEPATGRSIDVRHVHRFRIGDGRIVEHWAIRDDLRAMLQAGVLHRPGQSSGPS